MLSCYLSGFDYGLENFTDIFEVQDCSLSLTLQCNCNDRISYRIRSPDSVMQEKLEKVEENEILEMGTVKNSLCRTTNFTENATQVLLITHDLEVK